MILIRLAVNIIFLHICIGYVFGDIANDKDTVIKSFPEISVEAERYVLSRERVFIPYSIISKDDIDNFNSRQISDLLSRETSLFIRDYGGLGGIKTVSLRGTSSAQTLVMLEGMRINSIQSNSSDLSSIPASLLKSVEILRGGNSAISGGSSLGGTINFNLNDRPDKKLTANIGYGSINEYLASVTANANISDHASIGAGFEYLRSDGDYPFEINNYGESKTVKRENAAYQNAGLMINSSFKSGNWQNKIIALGRLTERGSPGPVLLGYVSPDNAKLYEKETDIIVKTERDFGGDYFKAAAMYRHNYERYFDPESINALRGDTNSIFRTNEMQFRSSYNLNVLPFQIDFGIDGAYSQLNGDFLQPEVNGKVSRTSCGASASMVYSLQGEMFVNSLIAAVRYDLFSDLPASPSALIGSSIAFNDISTVLKTQVSYNYRPPGFNEMYYLNYGTASLVPEKSISYNLSVSYVDNIFNAEINGFVIDTKDQIIAVPKSPLVWSARNLASVLSRGIELTAGLKLFKDVLTTGFSYTLQKVSDNDPGSSTFGKIVQYSPQELASGFIRFAYSGFTVNASGRYNGFTYALPDNSYESLVRSFYVVDINLQKRFVVDKINLILRFDVINLFDARFYVVKNYPMPGRILRAGLGMEL